MPTLLQDFEIQAPAEVKPAAEMGQDLLFLGLHSSTGVLRVQFIQGDELVAFEVQNPVLRTTILSALIDVAGELFHQREAEEASQL
jgi:hypothetical protein